jgi:Apea-like HEPN
LEERAVISGRDLSGCGIYILDKFSLQTDGVIVPGVEFLSARDLILGTNFVSLWNKSMSRGFGSQGPLLPARFTGAFITRPNPSHQTEYWDAIVSRILTAATITTSVVGGSVEVQLYVSAGEFRYHSRVNESWSMPFRPWPVSQVWTIGREARDFWRVVEVLASSNENRFASAKEDYRALSLETAADSRHSLAPAVQYTQIWMALERLLPFRHETTMQLAIALPALVGADARHTEFAKLRELYDLRSKIAHGYAFKRSQEIFGDIRRVSEIYRRVFKLSLSYDKSEVLQKALLEHVLTGRPRAIDGEAAAD